MKNFFVPLYQLLNQVNAIELEMGQQSMAQFQLNVAVLLLAQKFKTRRGTESLSEKMNGIA